MDLFREKLEAGRSLRIAFDDFDGINLEIRKSVQLKQSCSNSKIITLKFSTD